jgi:mono/diheme cytochrome c family protein
MTKSFLAAFCMLAAASTAFAQSGKGPSAEAKRGRYLVQIGGCNDCHTPGYPQSAGKVDEKLWLTGDALGWRGPWGTTYAANLRLVAQNMSAEQWVVAARRELRPPMPWFNLRDMSTADLRAIYAYLKHAGPAGSPAPAYLPPDKEPKPPFVQFPAPPKK